MDALIRSFIHKENQSDQMVLPVGSKIFEPEPETNSTDLPVGLKSVSVSILSIRSSDQNSAELSRTGSSS